MGWAPSHDAPRDRPVWLFLPSSRYTANPDGTPKEVFHESVVAQWNPTHGGWETKEGRRVYPSLWHDCPTDGVMPDNPLVVGNP